MPISGDELVTTYTLQDNYSQHAGKIIASSKGIVSSIGSVKTALGGGSGGGSGGGGGFLSSVMASMSEGLSMVIPFIETIISEFRTATYAALGFGTALAGLVIVSMKKAADFDSLARTFGAMLQSMEKGKQMMQYLQQYGLTSGFNLEPLAESARVLTMLNLKADKWLPVMETLAYGKGKPNDQTMTEMAEIFQRLGGGMTGHALGPEGLGRFGISRSMLEQYGAQFDKQGEFIGTLTDALRVLERVATESPVFKNLKEAFDDSPAVKMSNAIDAVTKALVSAGNVFNATFLPALDGAQQMISGLVDSGIVEDIATSFASMFGGPEGIKDSVVRFISLVAATLYYLPDIIQGVGDSIKGIGNMIIDTINKIIDVYNKIPFHDRMNHVSGQTLLQMGTAGFATLIAAKQAEFERRLSEGSGRAPVEAPTPDNAPQNTLQQIAGNTAKLVALKERQMNIARAAFGGGELGRMGLTSTELNGIRGGHSKLHRALGDLLVAIQEHTADTVSGHMVAYRRSGAI